MLTQQDQFRIISSCIMLLGNQLSKRVKLFGGKKMEQELQRSFLAKAEQLGLKVTPESYHLSTPSDNWPAYAELTSELIKLASNVVGSNAVDKEVVAVINQLEEKIDENLFETFFKLGIHKYMEK